MRKHEHRIVIFSVLSYIVLFDDLAVRNVKLKIGTLRIKKIKREKIGPAVIFDKLKMLFGGVTRTLVCGVAFNHRSTNVIYYRLPEIRL